MSGPSLALEGLSKRFGQTLAVDQVSLTVAEGQCFGLIGPNGAGKTTIFSMLCGFLRPSGGSVRVLGMNPSAPGALKGKVGVLPQDALLPPAVEVGALLTFWARLSFLPSPREQARGALARVGMEEAWGRRAETLSHGMAKRVAMAQALMGEPPLVLLDEPTAGLDPKIAAHIRQLIHQMRGRQTVVVSSHNLQELEELCDGAAILDHGRLVQAGSMAELTARSAEFRVRIASGEVPLEALRALPGCQGAALEAGSSLVVHYDGRQIAPEEMISETLSLLLRHEVRVLEVTRGRRLEQRVLELT